jgi:toxin ParE1/3/4
MKIIITENARLDLHEIVDYISNRESQTIAKQINKKIKEKIKDLSDYPEKGRIIPELDQFNIIKYKEIIVAPWRIIYKIQQNNIFVLNIIDGRRNLEDLLLKNLIR